MAPREDTPNGANSRPRYNDRNNDGPRERRDPRDNTRSNGGGGGGGGRRDNRSRSPRRGGVGSGGSYRGSDRNSGRRDDHHARTRSRSPRRDTNNTRETSTRQRSPPRGPRNSQAPLAQPAAAAAAAPSRPSTHQAPTSQHPNSTPSAPHPPIPASKPSIAEEEAVDGEELSTEDAEMRKTMGFAGFRSTKNTKVPGNDKLFGVRRDKQTEYRQYMNRQGGFNRPLDAMG